MSESELIDLNKRTQKELLLEVYSDVKDLKKSFESMKAHQSDQDVVIATVKTQLRGWAFLWGSVSAIIISLISKLLS